MRNCNVDDMGSEALAEGVQRNQTLKRLDLSGNRITQGSMKSWQDVIGKSFLRYFDISNNNLHDEGAICLLKGLLEGRSVIKDELMNAKQRSDPANWVKKAPKMKHLLMRNVSMGDEAGVVLSQLISHNRKIRRIAIEGNTINFKYVEEVAAACARNRQIQKRKVVPKFQQELGDLIQSTQPFGVKVTDPLQVKEVLYQQRENYKEELKFLNYQHMRKAQEVYAKEEVIAAVIEEETRAGRLLQGQKEDNEDRLKDMDRELQRLDRKEILNEQARIE